MVVLLVVVSSEPTCVICAWERGQIALSQIPSVGQVSELPQLIYFYAVVSSFL